jgi:hypothetical protein
MGGSGGGRGVQCFNCDEYGHYSDQCPFPKRARKGKGGEPSIRMETVRLGGSGRTVTKVIEFESAEQEARCMEAWKGVVADMEVDKQMPVLRAFGKAIGVPCDREVEKEVRRLLSGRDITPVKAQPTVEPGSGGSVDGGGLLVETQSMRGDLTKELKSITSSVTKLDTTVSTLQSSVIVVQSRLAAVEKEQDSGGWLMEDVLWWRCELDGGVGAVRKRSRDRAARREAAAGGFGTAPKTVVSGAQDTLSEFFGLLCGGRVGEDGDDRMAGGDGDLMVVEDPELAAGAVLSDVPIAVSEAVVGGGGFVPPMPKRNGKSAAEKEKEAKALKDAEILECSEYLQEHWGDSEWIKQCMDLVGKRLSTLQRMAKSNAPKIAKMLIEKGVKWMPGVNGCLSCMPVSKAVAVAVGVLGVSVEWVLSLLDQKLFGGGKGLKFCREVLRVLEEALAVFRVVQAFRWPLQREHSAVTAVMEGDLQWCLVRTLDRKGGLCDEGEGLVYALLGDKVYIGSTVDPERRRRQHRSAAWVQQQVRQCRQQVDFMKHGSDGSGMKDVKMEARTTQKVYEEMKLKGAGNFGLVAMRKVVFRKVREGAVSRQQQRKQRGRILKRVEHKDVREIRPSLNTLGMRQKRSGGRLGKAQRARRKRQQECGFFDVHVEEQRQQQQKVTWMKHQRKKCEQRKMKMVEARRKELRRQLAVYSVDGGPVTVDCSEVLAESVGFEVMIRMSPGEPRGTCWKTVAREFGHSTVEAVCNGKAMVCSLEELVDGRKLKAFRLQMQAAGAVLKIKVEKARGVDWEEVLSMVRWSRRRCEWQRSEKDTGLEELYRWESLWKHLRVAELREFVRKRIMQRVRKLGGEVVPKKLMLRLPAKARVAAGHISRLWMAAIDVEKAHLTEVLQQRWRMALRIVRAKGTTVRSWLVNNPAQCRSAHMQRCRDSRCRCAQHPELVGVMKSKHMDVWEANGGHVFMPLEDVPWRTSDVGSVSLDSEVTGSVQKVEQEAWEQMQKLMKRLMNGDGEKACDWIQRWKEELRVGREVDSGDRRFREGRLAEMKKACGEAFVVSGLDRDKGRSWLCCAELSDEVGRKHFEYCDSKEEQEQQTELKYWRVHAAEKELLQSWRQEYDRLNRVQCGGRWCAWNVKGEMCRVRWEFKRKKVMKSWAFDGLIRAIFSSVGDPAKKEMTVCAKGIGLVCRSLDLNDFSCQSGLQMAVWFREVEQQLSDVFGDETQLELGGTDFKNFFP